LQWLLGGSGQSAVPSNILTAVGKSLTRRAAFKAAMMTPGEGTKSYANALFKFLCKVSDHHVQAQPSSELYLKFEDILHLVELGLVSVKYRSANCPFRSSQVCSNSGVICANSSGGCAENKTVCSYLCENSSKVSSPCSELLCTADELKGDLAQMVDVAGATRAALGAARKAGRSNDGYGRAAARRTLRTMAIA